jgi:hypothetical protein
MVDVIIKNVPSRAEEKVKQLAMVAIERFVKTRDVKVTEAVTIKFEKDIDVIRVANNLDKKYERNVGQVVSKIVEQPVMDNNVPIVKEVI